MADPGQEIVVAPPPRVGRGSIYDQKIVDELLRRLSGGEGIINICRDAHMPVSARVYERMAVDEAFRALIARAREAQQESEIDQMIEIADGATPEDWQVAKLRIWARQWRAGKLAPKKYGDKPEAQAGTDENKVVVEIVNALPKDDA